MQSKSTDRVFPLIFDFGRIIKRRASISGKQILSLPQFETLYFIASAGEPLMREVAEHLRVKAPSATALIEELARSGHLIRIPDRMDRRQVRVQLTAKGKKVLDDLITRKTKIIDDVLSVLSKKDRDQFTQILQAIVSANKHK